MDTNWKVNYDSRKDILWIYRQGRPIVNTKEVYPGANLEYDPKGKIIGVEVIGASEKWKIIKSNITRRIPTIKELSLPPLIPEDRLKAKIKERIEELSEKEKETKRALMELTKSLESMRIPNFIVEAKGEITKNLIKSVKNVAVKEREKIARDISESVKNFVTTIQFANLLLNILSLNILQNQLELSKNSFNENRDFLNKYITFSKEVSELKPTNVLDIISKDLNKLERKALEWEAIHNKYLKFINHIVDEFKQLKVPPFEEDIED